MRSKGKIVAKWSILGINFYERFQLKKTVFSKYSRINGKYIQNTGLSVLVKQYPKHNIFTQNTERTEIIFDIFSLTLINLFNSGIIDITRIIERKRYFFGFSDFEYSIYKISKIKEPDTPCIFTTMVLKEIADNTIFKHGIPLKFVLKNVLDQLLGNDYYGDSSASFIERLMKNNNSEFGWPEILADKNFLGIVTKHHYTLKDNQRKTLQKEFNNISVIRGQLSRNYTFIRAFLIELKDLINLDFNDRLPPNDD